METLVEKALEKLVEKALENLIDKFNDNLIDYLQDQFRWQTGMKEELERLQHSFPMVQAVFSAASQVRTADQNSALDRWILQLHLAIEDANSLINSCRPNQPQDPSVDNIACRSAKRIRVFYQRALKIDPKLNKLEEVLGKFDQISSEATIFLRLVKSREKEQRKQQVELRRARETGCLIRNDLIGRDEVKDQVMRWLREASNEVTTNTLYRNISVLSIVGESGSGKTTLLQHVYANEKITEEFDLKMWVCVLGSFDVKKVIADVLESVQMRRPSLSSLAVLQNSLKCEVLSKKFLLVLDDIQEEGDVSKLEDLLSCLRDGGFGSKILITTRKDSVASMIANVIRQEKNALQITSILF